MPAELALPNQPDAELIRIARAGRSTLGCYVWLIVPAAPISLGFVYGTDLAWLGFLGALAVVMLALHARSKLPAVQHAIDAEREFEQRWNIGASAQAQAEADAQASLAQDVDLEAVVLFVGRSLPHGQHRFVRIDLSRRESRLRALVTPA